MTEAFVEAAKHIPALLVSIGAIVLIVKLTSDRYEKILREIQLQHSREMDALRAQQTAHANQLREAHSDTIKAKDDVIDRQVKEIASLQRRLGKLPPEEKQ